MKILKKIAFLLLFVFVLPYSVAVAADGIKLSVVVLSNSTLINPSLQEGHRFSVQLEKQLRLIGFNVGVKSVGDVEMTSGAALEKIDSILSNAPDILIIQIGEVDISRRFSHGFLSDNLNAIVDKLVNKGVYVIVFRTRAAEAVNKDYAEKISKVFENLAKKASVFDDPYVLVSTNPDLTLGDGVSPNGKGVALIVENVYRAVDAGLRWRIEAINKLMKQRYEENTKK